jgi:hypothetical protein
MALRHAGLFFAVLPLALSAQLPDTSLASRMRDLPFTSVAR